MAPADLTLVINLCAGDAAYAHLTAGALIKAHRKTAKEVVIILDDTIAQYSDFYDHKKRYHNPTYTQNLTEIASSLQKLKQEGSVDSVIKLSNYIIKKNLNLSYLNNRIKDTHDFRGAPITAYLAGFDVCKTKYLVRYDGDMLLHQSNKDWVLKGMDLLEQFPDCIAVSPQPSPPTLGQKAEINYDPVYWFSTRCTLFNLNKLKNTIPFLQGKFRFEVLARKWLNKTYPPALETILFHRFKSLNLKNYYLLNQESWLLHPEEKNERFTKLLPHIIAEIEKGNYPIEQANNEMLKLDSWQKHLQQKLEG